MPKKETKSQRHSIKAPRSNAPGQHVRSCAGILYKDKGKGKKKGKKKTLPTPRVILTYHEQ